MTMDLRREKSIEDSRYVEREWQPGKVYYAINVSEIKVDRPKAIMVEDGIWLPKWAIIVHEPDDRPGIWISVPGRMAHEKGLVRRPEAYMDLRRPS